FFFFFFKKKKKKKNSGSSTFLSSGSAARKSLSSWFHWHQSMTSADKEKNREKNKETNGEHVKMDEKKEQILNVVKTWKVRLCALQDEIVELRTQNEALQDTVHLLQWQLEQQRCYHASPLHVSIGTQTTSQHHHSHAHSNDNANVAKNTIKNIVEGSKV
ncbi:hypothetical protein RFI_33272, partial [Reticulomyxa filosa]